MSADIRNNGNVWIIEDRHKPPSTANDYEKAVATTGYGFFNILLLFAALPIGWTCIIDTTSTAFIINTIECDFNLSVLQKSIAMSTIYIGMILSGPLWDFFLYEYIDSIMDKKNVIIIGIFLDAVCNVLWIHATSFNMFIILKFISGILIAGPLSVLMAYLAEFHAPMYQPKFTRWANLLIAVSNIIPAALAATLFLRTPWFNFTIYNRFYPTWRAYLLICGIPSVLGLFTACLMPRSPKFLMAQGKCHEALRLLRIMFCMNNFKSPSQYQITDLVSQPRRRIRKSFDYKDNLQKTFSKLKILFSEQHLKTISIILFIQFSSMIGFNVMRLWVPSIFVILNNFSKFLKRYYPASSYITMCEMIFPHVKNIDYKSCNYTLPSVESAVYVNSTIIATSAVVFGFLFTFITDKRIIKVIVIVFTFFLSTIGSFGANWAIKIPYMLTLLGFIIVASRITGNSVASYNAQVIPQMLRSTAVSLLNFIGNFGAAIGNIIFSLIFEFNCMSAFLSLGCLTLVSVVMSLFLLRQPNNKITPETEPNRY